MSEIPNTADTGAAPEVASEVVDAAKPMSVQDELQQDLIVVTKELAALAKLQDGMKELKKLYPLDVVLDVSTKKGMTEAVNGRAAYRGVKGNVEQSRQRAKAPILTMGRKLDGMAGELNRECQAGQDYYDEAIKVEERRKENDRLERERVEAVRVDTLRQRVQDILDVAVRAVNLGSADIAKKIDLITRQEIGDDFLEFKAHAINAKAETLVKLGDLSKAAVEREARDEQARKDAAELQLLRERQAEETARRQAEERKRAEVEAFEREMRDLRRASLTFSVPDLRVRADDLVDIFPPSEAGVALRDEIVIEFRERADRLEAEQLQRQLAETKSAQHQERLNIVASMQQIAMLANAAKPNDAVKAFIEHNREELAKIELTAEMFEDLLPMATGMKQSAEVALNSLHDRWVAATEAEDRANALSEISGIQQQPDIAISGRLGVREGGTIECIRETLAETEAWPIDDRFGALRGVAQSAKDSAVRQIRDMLELAERKSVDDAQRVADDLAAQTHASAAEASSAVDGSQNSNGGEHNVSSPDQSWTAEGQVLVGGVAVPSGDIPPGTLVEEVSHPGVAVTIENLGHPLSVEVREEGDDKVVIVRDPDPAYVHLPETDNDPEFTRVPILINHEATKSIGWLEIMTKELPPTPEFCFALGYQAIEMRSFDDTLRLVVTKYELREVSLIADRLYARALEHEGVCRLPIEIPPPREDDDRPEITTGDIQEWLGIPIAGVFIEKMLKVAPERNKGKAMWWRASEFLPICKALIEHLEGVAARYPR